MVKIKDKQKNNIDFLTDDDCLDEKEEQELEEFDLMEDDSF